MPFVALTTACGSSEVVTFDATINVSPRETGNFETFYSDDYFALDPTEYHQELALVSHAMALSAFPVSTFKEDYSTQPNNLKSFWKSIGFTDVWCAQSYYEKTEVDSIGYAFSRKTMALNGETYTVIAIGIRGADYQAEWASNVTLGDSGDAKGFFDATCTVLGGLAHYVELRHITGKVKFWTAGYSRAAITANMVAGNLTGDTIDGSTLFADQVIYTQKDVYAYCFEPPMGVVDDYDRAHTERYANIHNLVNLNDVVPLVAPDQWGFTRYGVDHYYPDRLTDIHFDERCREKAVTRYHFTPSGTALPGYDMDDWLFVDVGADFAKTNGLPRASINPSQARFIRDLVDCLARDGFLTRINYSLFGQVPLARLFAILNGRDDVISPKDISIEKILTLFFEYSLLNVLLTELLNNDPTSFAMNLEPFFFQILGGPKVSNADIEDFYLTFVFALYAFANAFSHRQDVLLQLMNIGNLMRVKLAHMPELSYAWLGSCDSRYYGNDANQLNDGSYYILSVQNATHINIYETDFDRTIFDGYGEKMTSDILSAQYYPDGHTEIYLPKNGTYVYTFEGEGAVATLTSIDPHLNRTTVKENLVDTGSIG